MIPALIVGFASFGPLAAPNRDDRDADLPTANQAILTFARERVGAKVGDGTCSDLAHAACKQAKISPRYEEGDDGVNIVWGEPVARRAEYLPGDILEFRDVALSGRRRVWRDGKAAVLSYQIKMAHHTAIVDEVRDKGRVLVVLHQNFGAEDEAEESRRRVRRDTIRVADLKSGTIQAFRPTGE